MSEIRKKRRPISSRIGVLIAIATIMIVVILVLFYAPPESDSNNVTGDLPATPTLGITNLVETVDMNYVFQYKGVDITITKAMIATNFSDDRKRGGTYTVRVMAKTENKGQNPTGIQYADIVHLALPDGTVIAPKRVSVKPLDMPGRPQTGYFDFPISTKIPLSSLTLRFDRETAIPLKATA